MTAKQTFLDYERQRERDLRELANRLLKTHNYFLWVAVSEQRRIVSENIARITKGRTDGNRE